MIKQFIIVSVALFIANVIAVAWQWPWYLRPFELVLEGMTHVRHWVEVMAGLVADVAIWCAWHLQELVKRLGPAFTTTLGSYVGILGSPPSWIATFWTTLSAAFRAAAGKVAEWFSWTVVAVIAASVVAIAAWLLFYKTNKGQEMLRWCLSYHETTSGYIRGLYDAITIPPPSADAVLENLPRRGRAASTRYRRADGDYS